MRLQNFLFESKSWAILVRLTVASAILLVLVIFFSRHIASALLPLYRTVFELVAGDYRILFLGLSSEGADSVIRIDVTLSRTIAVAGHLVIANPQGIASASTMIGNIFQPLTLGLIAILTWPAASWRIVILRLLILTLLLLVETILNIPMLLAGNIWGIFLDNLTPGSTSPLTAWADFLQSGGRFAIGLLAAIGSIAASDYAASISWIRGKREK